MSAGQRLALIAAGYALATVGGLAAIEVNELLIPEEISQTSGGMVAFGDMILFVLVTGFVGLAPTWFLLKLCVEKAPRTLLVVLLLVAATGPASWLAVKTLFGGGPPTDPVHGVGQALGLLIVLGAIPRIVFGPVLLVIEAMSCLIFRWRVARALMGAAMLMDLIPLGLYALHMAHAIQR